MTLLRRTAAALTVAAVALALSASATTAANPRSDLKNYQHVFVIMMENTGYNALIGNPNAPWTNSAAQRYGLATNYFGVIHPSQPNYIAATSGITGDDSDADETLAVPNIVDQLESAGKTWTAYMQSYSLCNGNAFAHACGNQLYERKHNPFISYADVQSSPARISHIVDLSQLNADLASGHVADYTWITPDQCNDMHGRGGPPSDPCSFANEQNLIAMGDAFLREWVTKIMSSSAWNGNSAIFVTWDESEFTGAGDFGFGDESGCCDSIPGHGGGHVITLVISHSDHTPRQSSTAYNHYSLLSTIQAGWRLGCLGFTCDTANVKPMADLVGPR